jgi:hypothetical protein
MNRWLIIAVIAVVLAGLWPASQLVAPPFAVPAAPAAAQVDMIVNDNLVKLFDYAVQNGTVEQNGPEWMVALSHREPSQWHNPAWPDRREFMVWQGNMTTAGPRMAGMYFIEEQWRKDLLGRDVVDQWMVSINPATGSLNFVHSRMVEWRGRVLSDTRLPASGIDAVTVMRVVIIRFMGEAGLH